ncbi:hypothetical protein AB0D67_30520 [Streptosporangium sp. NPDC048047]|uniref:hypothetical protein n=1 Tax=Streptosporangium sp. NPDC048047 TaxID=3155748 RepID=UPI00341F7435
MTSLLARLGRAEEATRQQCAELSRQLEELQERLATAQRRLERLSIAREELAVLAADAEPGDTKPGDSAGYGHRHDDVAAHGAGLGEAPGSARPALRGLRKEAVVLLASSDKPLRARDVVRALGQQDVRGRVEGMRARLKRLVNDGWLVEREQGLFTIASGVNGFTGEGDTATD